MCMILTNFVMMTHLMWHTQYNRAINSDHLTGIFGPDNACSFQSLAYYLTTGSQYLLESSMCRVSDSEDTIVNFAAYCG